MKAKDCCVGEPGGGDPRGMHSYDCPEYLAFARWLEQQATPAVMVTTEPLPTGSTSAQLRQTQTALAASQADLTATRGQVVDLLYIIDAFQIESGADRNASYSAGIEAVRQLRAVRDQLAGQLQAERDRHGVLWRIERDACVQLRRRLLAAEGKRDLAEAELATARAELERLRNQTNPEGAS